MPDDQAPTQLSLDLRLAPELEGGVYANGVVVWHSGHEFTLDFYSTQLPGPPQEGVLQLPARVTSRVKVPPTVLFEIIQTMNHNMTNYEATFGAIQQIGQPSQVPPDDLIGPPPPSA